MEAIKFEYSTLNIPIPSEKDYLRKLIEKTEHLCRRMRWKAYFFLNPNAKPDYKETYGFKSHKIPPQIPALLSFEKKLTAMIKRIKFKRVHCEFQNKLNKDIRTHTTNTSKLLIAADKTTNFYKMNQCEYDQLLSKNLTKAYKKTNKKAFIKINQASKDIARRLKLDDRINTTAEREAFISLKDHKPNFRNNPSCRLINPTKPEVGKISKQILDKINKGILATTKVNLWKNTAEMLRWFDSITNKDEYSFIVFDIVDFYPSISPKLLEDALDFACNHFTITDEERHIIMHTKNSMLTSRGEYWSKSSSSNFFDVTMGSYDGAETCELVGAFLLNKINATFNHPFGLYRDDGIGLIKASPRSTERMKKELCNIFKQYELQITIDANKKIIDYLDVTLNLHTGTYAPYNKPNNCPLYVNVKSNHPPQITRNIPHSINQRLSTISSNESTFNLATPIYQKALQESGYKHKLHYQCTVNSISEGRNRKRNTLWYNPPFSKNVTTNVGKTFLKLVNSEFPIDNPLHKIFNSNTVKVSYSCMGNIKNIIDGHNKAIISKTESPVQAGCNCRKKEECPMKGQCQARNIIYQATVKTDNSNSDETYIGLTENTFKTRFGNHKASFNHASKQSSTELSKHIWDLKNNNIDFKIEWKIIKHANPYNNSTGKCNLCNLEKYYITCKPEMASLNKRNELISTCRHSSKYLLKNWKDAG